MERFNCPNFVLFHFRHFCTEFFSNANSFSMPISPSICIHLVKRTFLLISLGLDRCASASNAPTRQRRRLFWTHSPMNSCILDFKWSCEHALHLYMEFGGRYALCVGDGRKKSAIKRSAQYIAAAVCKPNRQLNCPHSPTTDSCMVP